MDRLYKRIWTKKDNGRLTNFPVKLIKLAFFTLVKTSQDRYFQACNIQTITRGGLIFALTRYTVALMLCLFGSPYLPVLSNRDNFLVPLLVREAHVMICNGKKIHLTPELTVNRLLGSSLSAVYIIDMKRTVSNFIKNCIHCNKKKAAKGKFRSFVHELGDPMMVSHLENSDLDVGFFNRISIDSLEVPVRVRAGQRGGATHKVGILFGVCLQTGFFFTTVLDSLTMSNILAALKVIFIKYSRPKVIICDNFSSFNALKKANPWLDVEMVVRQTAHQFSNPVEASIKVFK